MSALQASATMSSPDSPLPYPVALAHTYNSRGELGMFVNPYACSCTTCVNHVAHGGHEVEVQEASPPPPPTRQVTLQEDQVSLLKMLITSRADEIIRQQDSITHETAVSHDEMAAMDTQWDELDTELNKLELILNSLK